MSACYPPLVLRRIGSSISTYMRTQNIYCKSSTKLYIQHDMLYSLWVRWIPLHLSPSIFVVQLCKIKQLQYISTSQAVRQLLVLLHTQSQLANLHTLIKLWCAGAMHTVCMHLHMHIYLCILHTNTVAVLHGY